MPKADIESFDHRVSKCSIKLHAAKAEFEREIAELQRQLDDARLELRKLRALDLVRWQPTDARLN